MRRQEILRAAGNLVSVTDYAAARRARPELPPLPALVVVVDEFSELLAQRPELIDLMVTIGRLGRSLGLHLLLASQRLEEGRLRGLESHLSYRIALRTFSASESRAVLGVPDAHQLPPTPGLGVPRDGHRRARAVPRRLRVRPVRAGRRRRRRRRAADQGLPVRDRARAGGRPAPPARAGPRRTGRPPCWRRSSRRSPVGVRPRTVSGCRRLPRRRRWTRCRGAVRGSGRGLAAAERGGGTGRCRSPSALVDRPYLQRREPLDRRSLRRVAVTSPSSAGRGRASRAGSRRSSSASRSPTPPSRSACTCSTSAAARCGRSPGCPTWARSPTGRRSISCAAPSPSAAPLSAVGSGCSARPGSTSVEAFRARRAAGEFADEPATDLLLVVDGYLTLRGGVRGPRGAAAARWRPRAWPTGCTWPCRPPAGRSCGLRSRTSSAPGWSCGLGEPAESEIDRRRAATVPARPGHGLAVDGAALVLAAPHGAAEPDITALVTRVAGRVERPGVRAGAAPSDADRPRGPSARHVRHPARCRRGAARARRDRIRPPSRTCSASPMRRAARRPCCGWSRGASPRRFAPQQARVVVVDHRRGLLGAVPAAHLIGYASTPEQTAAAVRSLEESLRKRLPGSEVTARELRERSWWQGPEVYPAHRRLRPRRAGRAPRLHPLLPIVELLAQAKDVGLHVVVARRCGGAGRALFDPLLGRLKELGAPGLVLNGSPDEGALVETVKASPQPPGRGMLVDRRRGRAPDPAGVAGPRRGTGVSASRVAVAPGKARCAAGGRPQAPVLPRLLAELPADVDDRASALAGLVGPEVDELVLVYPPGRVAPSVRAWLDAAAGLPLSNGNGGARRRARRGRPRPGGRARSGRPSSPRSPTPRCARPVRVWRVAGPVAASAGADAAGVAAGGRAGPRPAGADVRAVLDVGRSGAEAVVLRAGRILARRSSAVGGDRLDLAVRALLPEASASDARRVREALSLLPETRHGSAVITADQVREVLTPLVDEAVAVLAEVVAVVDGPVAVLLTGGVARCPLLAERVDAAGLASDVRVAPRPDLAAVLGALALPRPPGGSVAAASAATATLVAARGSPSARRTAEFLPPPRAARSVRRWAGAALAALLVGGVAAAGTAFAVPLRPVPVAVVDVPAGVLVQYGYRLDIPAGWEHTGGLPERRRSLLTRVGAPDGTDLIAVERTPLGYDADAEHERAAAELRAEFDRSVSAGVGPVGLRGRPVRWPPRHHLPPAGARGCRRRVVRRARRRCAAVRRLQAHTSGRGGGAGRLRGRRRVGPSCMIAVSARCGAWSAVPAPPA